MLKEVKFRIFSVKCIIVLSGLLLITVSCFAQAPEWQWATNAGGTDDDHGYAIAIDYEGNSYVTGNFVGTVNFGAYSITSCELLDIYVAKMDKDGNWLWATRAGGFDWDSGSGIAVDNMGNAYVTGYFIMTADFGPYSLTSMGFDDVFVAKIDKDGNWLWVNQAGGTHYDGGGKTTIDDAGNCYVSGCFMNTAYFGPYSLTTSGLKDGFVAKLDSCGAWQWAKKAGGTSWDYARGITIDEAGNVYVLGDFSGTAHFGSYSLTSIGSNDIFIAKINSNGTWLWASQAGGANMDVGNAITIDDAGSSYITGIFENVAHFGSYYIQGSGSYDIFVAKINTDGVWQWAKKAGGVNYDDGKGITVDNSGNSYVTGGFEGVAYFGSDSIISYGGRDIFVAKIDTIGMWEWVTNAGGISSDKGSGIALDNEYNCCVTGFFNGISTFGSQIITSNGYYDIFVAKLTPPVSTDPEINQDADILSNYPNPFDQRTVINYALRRETEVSLEVYNIKGQLVETLFEGTQQPGDHTIEWDCVDMPSGMYFFKMKAGDEECIRKMILLR